MTELNENQFALICSIVVVFAVILIRAYVAWKDRK